TILPPNAHTSQWHQEFASPVALPSANPGGVPFAFGALHSSRKPAVSFGNSLKPAACTWLMRCVKQAPAAPRGTAMHLPPDTPPVSPAHARAGARLPPGRPTSSENPYA